MGHDGVCRVRLDPSGRGMLTRNTSLARVLFFFEPASPMRASTSALRSFKIPTQSTLQRFRQSAPLPWQRAHTTPPPFHCPMRHSKPQTIFSALTKTFLYQLLLKLNCNIPIKFISGCGERNEVYKPSKLPIPLHLQTERSQQRNF